MTPQPLIIESTVNAPIEKAWEALTNKDQIKEWYFDIPNFKPEVGFEFEFSGKGKEGEDYLHKCKITEIIPQKKLTHTWRYDGFEGHSSVSFELETAGNATNIKLTHSGLATFPKVEAFAEKNFREGWTYIIGSSLKDFLEKG